MPVSGLMQTRRARSSSVGLGFKVHLTAGLGLVFSVGRGRWGGLQGGLGAHEHGQGLE